MLCNGEANTRGAYIVAMIDGGRWMKTCIIVVELTKDMEEEGLGGIE